MTSPTLDADITILIVDDSEEDRVTYMRYLQSDLSRSYNFLEAATLEEGLNCWRSHQPDIVLVDYSLPDGEGLELLEAMGEGVLVPKLEAIVLTGHRGNEQLILQTMRLGAADYLSKSEVTALSLCNRVGRVVDHLLLSRKLQRLQNQEIVIAKIALHIRQYFDLEEISNAIVQEIRAFLKADRTVIYQFNSDMSGVIIAESVFPPWETCIHRQLNDEYFPENMGGEYREGRVFIAPDIYKANLSECHLHMLEQFPTRASLIVPILRPNNLDHPLWGLLCTYQCFEPHFWDELDIRLLQQLSVQLAIALQQAELYRSLQISNTDLENRVNERTAELFKRQQESTALVENSPNLILRLDRQLRHLYINSAIEKILGIPPAAFIGKTFREMGLPESNILAAEDAIRNLVAMGIPQQYEIDFPLPNNRGIAYYQVRVIPEYDADGEISTILMVFADITSNKLSEFALQEANRRWQSLLDNVRLIVIGLDNEWKVEYANPFFLESMGYELAEVIGKDWLSCFVPQSEQENIRRDFGGFLNNPDKFLKYYQNAIVTKSGQERVVAWNNTILRNQDNEIIGTMSIGEDITDKLKVERIKSEFISIASHELRTPLSSIRGALGLLASGVLANQPEVAQNMLNIASSDTERLVRLVNDILDLERLESNNVTLNRQWSDTAEICQQVIETMEAIAAKSQIEIISNVPSQQIFADRDRLVQTLVNLLSNAVKFSMPHSQVHLEVEAITDEIIFRVRDHGRGIPESNLESIFERFNQVDASDSRQMGGTGLGLAICRSIVQQHGGKIWAESVLNQGSTVSFTIPHRI